MGDRGHEFETRHPLHFGCVLSLRCRATWCWRCGMCATLGQATCSETPHPTGCSRLGTAEVDSFALVAQQAEQPPCKRQAARSIRRRGHQNKSCSSSRPRTPGFQSGNAGSNPARDASRSFQHGGVAQPWQSSRLASGRLRVRIPPFPPRSVNSAARVPACRAGSRGFESRTGRHVMPG